MSSLTKVSNTLIKLYIYLRDFDMPLSFIAEFINLQKLALPYVNNTESFILIN